MNELQKLKSLIQLEWLAVPDELVRPYLLYDREMRPTPKPSYYEAITLFENELYDICIDKITNNEEVYRFEKLLNQLKSIKRGEKPELLNIERARAYPIEELVRRYGLEPRMGFVECRFHNEKTPSLKLYPATNTWHCFGCGGGSSVIDFVMAMNKCNFKEAINFLT